MAPRYLCTVALALLLPPPSAAQTPAATAFAALDLNSNGMLTRMEVRRGKAALAEVGWTGELDALFERADSSKDSTVSLAELNVALGGAAPPPTTAPPQAGKTDDASAGQKKKPVYSDCESCLAAGLGWSLQKGKCGGFPNKRCPTPEPAASEQPPPAEAVSAADMLARAQKTHQAALDDLQAQVAALAADKDSLQEQLREASQAAAVAPPAQQQQGGLCQAADATRSRWRPSPSDIAGFKEDMSPFGWTPIWTAMTTGSGSKLTMRALKAQLKKQQEKYPRSAPSKSNAGGFHSDGDLLGEGAASSPEIGDGDARIGVLKLVKDEIYTQIHAYMRALADATKRVGGPGLKRYRIELGNSWYNINGVGHYNNAHTHDGSHISGVLYVDTGGDTTACTQFFDSNGYHSEPFSPSNASQGLFRRVWGGSNAPTDYCPKSGQIVLFPAWLEHSVRTFTGPGKKRISISFNAVLEERYPTGQEKLSAHERKSPGALSGNEDVARCTALAGPIPQWADGTDTAAVGLGGHAPNGVEPSTAPVHMASVSRSALKLHWPTPIRPVMVPWSKPFGVALDAMKARLLALEAAHPARDREGWSWAGILGASTEAHSGVSNLHGVQPDKALEAAEDHGAAYLRGVIYKQLYYHYYEMLTEEARRGGAEISLDLIDATAMLIRPGEMILQKARGDAHVCGVLSLDLGLKQSGRQQSNDIEMVDPRPMYSGTSAAYRNAKQSSMYFWEMVNLGGRKISFGLVPGLVMTWPCWLKWDMEPQKPVDNPGDPRSLIWFAARADIRPSPSAAAGEEQPVWLDTPAAHALD